MGAGGAANAADSAGPGASTAAVTGAPASEAAPEPRRWDLDVGAREEYRFRTSASPDESDHELRLDLDFGIRNPSGSFHAAGDLTLWWDAFRAPAESEGKPFGLGTVQAGRNPWFNVFQLYGEYAGNGVLRTVRAGRQDAEHGRPAAFDGAYLALRPAPRLSLFAFGGRTEHFFETNMPLFEDWIASAGAGFRVLEGLRLEADYRFLREAVPSEGGRTPVLNHSYGLTVFYRVASLVQATVGVRGLDGGLGEVRGVLRLFLPKQEFGVDAHVYVQPVELKELNEYDNPYFLTLGSSLPHARWKLDLYKVLTLTRGGGRLEAHLGYAGRQLLDGEETPFNRNVARLYGLLGAYDLGLKGLFVQVSLDRVSDHAFPVLGKGLFAVNAALGYERDWLRVEAGTQYHRWQYSYYQDVEELADVRVYFLEARVRPLSWLALRARYSAETFDRVLHTVTVGLTQTY